MASRAALVVLVLGSLFAAGAPADPERGDQVAVRLHRASGHGPRHRGDGGHPEEDGSYRILAVTGRRNGKRIVELLPAGEMLTSLEQFMFADNRLLPASPYLARAGSPTGPPTRTTTISATPVVSGTAAPSGYREFDGKKGDREVRVRAHADT